MVMSYITMMLEVVSELPGAQGMNADILDRLFDAALVVLGAVISMGTALLFERWRLRLRDQETASGIVSKFFAAYNAILGTKSQIEAMLLRGGNPDPPDRWAVVMQLIGGSDELNELNGLELSLLHRTKEAGLFNEIAEVLRANRIIHHSVEKYNELRSLTQAAAAPHARFDVGADGAPMGRIELDREQYPVVYSKILECNSVLAGLMESLERGERLANATKLSLNAAIERNRRSWGRVPGIADPA